MQRAFTVNHHHHLFAQSVRQKSFSFRHDNNLVTMLSSNSPTETVQLRINQTMIKRNNSQKTDALIAPIAEKNTRQFCVFTVILLFHHLLDSDFSQKLTE
ncbi:Uncharacterised protein [Campylobacter jejuni]|jgi:hypothetical protein|nr:hypothetical protein A9993_20750 [Rahnella victoriana]VTQ53695.1 Uncharacterised protein [Campylobacter jejuni]